MALLRPLLLDNVPSIQQSAALALGRLANYSDELAEAVVSNEILPQLVYSLSEQNVSAVTVTKLGYGTLPYPKIRIWQL
jgi:HEAT repeat protein